MFLGRYQLGEEVSFELLTRDASGTPQAPTNAPLMTVLDADGDRPINGKGVPSRDYPRLTGLFEPKFLLDERFSAGQYTVLITWLVSGTPLGRLHVFTILPGGQGSGQVTSLYSFPRPNANYVVQGRSSGRIYKGKNPRI